MRARRAALLAFVLGTSLATTAGAADDHGDHMAAAAPAASGAVRQVAIPGKAYAPDRLDVLVGDTVTWTNSDGLTHTVTAGDDSFDSGFMGPGATFSRTFDRPATIPYACTIHKFMTGTIRVVPVAFRGPEGAVRPGGSAGIAGLAPTSTERVAVERLTGRRWVAFRAVRPTPDGTFTVRVRVTRPDAFRARVGGAVSAVVRVAVAPDVTARLVDGVVRATASPARPGARAVLQRYDRDHFTWRTVARTRVVRGRPIELPLDGARGGHVRVVVRGGDGWADGASRALSLR